MPNPRPNRGLRPRSTQMYSNQQHGKRDSNLPPGDHTINSKLARVNLIKPQFKKGALIFRPWPPLLPSDPSKLAPGREAVTARGLSHWLVRTSAAKFIGINNPACERVTFNLYEPWRDDQEKRKNPFKVLFFACKNAEKEGKFGNGHKWDAEWNKIMKGGANRGAELSGPSALWFCSGHVFCNGEKNYIENDRLLPLGLHEGDDLPVLQLSDSGGDQLINLLDTPKGNYQTTGEEDEKPFLPFKYGDPTGLPNEATGGVEGGLIVTIFNPAHAKVIKSRETGKQIVLVDNTREYPLTNTSWDGKIKEAGQGYEVALGKVFKADNQLTFRADMDADQVARVLQLWQFFMPDPSSGQEGLLQFPSYEEQAVLIAKAFKVVPQMLEFGWADHPEYLNDDVQAILNERRGAVVPGEGEDYQDDQPAGAQTPRRPRTDPTQRASRPAAPPEDDFEESGAAGEAVADDGVEAPVDDDTFEDPADTAPTEPVETAGVDDFAEEGTGATAVADADDTFPDDVQAAGEEAAVEETLPEGEEAATDATGEPVVDSDEPEPGSEAEFEEDTTPPAAVEGEDDAVEQRMKQTMAEAKQRASRRASVQTAAPAQATTPKPGVPSGKPPAPPSGKPQTTQGRGKPPAPPAGKPTATPSGKPPGTPLIKPPAPPSGKPAATAAPARTGTATATAPKPPVAGNKPAGRPPAKPPAAARK